MLKLISGMAAAALVAVCLQARETVCLRNGFCLQAEAHLTSDKTLVVQLGEGTLQFPVEEVERIVPLTTVGNVSAVATKAFPPSSAEDLLISAAVREGLQPEFVRSVAKIESGLHQNALSPKGAVGLMQLMPYTAGRLGVDAHIVEQNVNGGAAYLRQLLLKYQGDPVLALAAYNAGPGAVDRYKGVPPYVETRRYIVKVLAEYKTSQRQQELKVAALR